MLILPYLAARVCDSLKVLMFCWSGCLYLEKVEKDIMTWDRGVGFSR